jgi:hypothetical protein
MTAMYVYRTLRNNKNEPSWGTDAAINIGKVERVWIDNLQSSRTMLRHMGFQTQLQQPEVLLSQQVIQ